MKTCKTCIHWNNDKDEWHLSQQGHHTGECKSPKFVYKSYDEKPDDNGLVYWDAEAYAAGLRTGRNFGCIHHKEK